MLQIVLRIMFAVAAVPYKNNRAPQKYRGPMLKFNFDDIDTATEACKVYYHNYFIYVLDREDLPIEEVPVESTRASPVLNNQHTYDPRKCVFGCQDTRKYADMMSDDHIQLRIKFGFQLLCRPLKSIDFYDEASKLSLEDVVRVRPEQPGLGMTYTLLRRGPLDADKYDLGMLRKCACKNIPSLAPELPVNRPKKRRVDSAVSTEQHVKPQTSTLDNIPEPVDLVASLIYLGELLANEDQVPLSDILAQAKED
ncbi:hypothetical protein MRB53_040899 [Persea americana]|nr:hypothetical protein MRB53_040899 [Persea americana]